MNITIKRIRKKGNAIDGHLFIDGSRICDSAENVNGAIPTGTNKLNIQKCKQYARKMVLLNPEPPCSKCPSLDFCGNNTTLPCYCPMIKPGNGVFNRKDGSIIVGTFIAPGCLKHPKEAFSAIYDRLRKSAERGHEISLTIEEYYPQPAPRELTPYMMGTQIIKQF